MSANEEETNASTKLRLNWPFMKVKVTKSWILNILLIWSLTEELSATGVEFAGSPDMTLK